MADAAALPMSQDGKHIIAASKSTPMAETLSASFFVCAGLANTIDCGDNAADGRRAAGRVL
jgi:hypothetical protein